MYSAPFLEIIKEIQLKDPRYDSEAYVFVREALDYTSKTLQKPSQGEGKHVSGQELLEGIRGYAIQEFGPMAFRVLKTWGVTATEDFGEIVFNMVGSGALGSTAKDKREDFTEGYDFADAFQKPFMPLGIRNEHE